MNDSRISADLLQEIVEKLIGDIYPVGSESIDSERKKNLDVYIELVLGLTNELYRVAENKDDYRSSVRNMGVKAFNYLKGEYEVFPECFNLEEEKEDE